MSKLTKILFVTFLFCTMVCSLWSIADAAVPRLINYQGRLTDSGGTPLNGTYSLTLRIYDAEAAGNLLWQETHSAVVIQKGIFSILLGSVTNLDLLFDKQYYLEIKVGNEVMSPRQGITSAGYAVKSEKAEVADKALTIEARTSDPASPVAGQVWLRTDSVNTNVIKLSDTNHTYSGTTYGSGENSTDGDFSTYQADSADQQILNGNYTKTSISQHTWASGITINSITYKIRTRAYVTGVQGTSYEYHQKLEYTTNGTDWIIVPGTLVEGGPFGTNQGDKDVTTNMTITPNLTGVRGIRAYCSVHGQQNDGWIFLANQIFEIQAFSNLKIGLRVYDGEKTITIAR